MGGINMRGSWKTYLLTYEGKPVAYFTAENLQRARQITKEVENSSPFEFDCMRTTSEKYRSDLPTLFDFLAGLELLDN